MVTSDIKSCGIAVSMAALFTEAYHDAVLRLAGKLEGLREGSGLQSDEEALKDPRVRAINSAISMALNGSAYFSELALEIRSLVKPLITVVVEAVGKRNETFLKSPENAELLKILDVTPS